MFLGSYIYIYIYIYIYTLMKIKKNNIFKIYKLTFKLN